MRVLAALAAITLFVCGCHAVDLAGATVLVTGAAGLIGSHLVINLVKNGCKSVVAVDSFDASYDVYYKRMRARAVLNATGVHIRQADICAGQHMATLLSPSEGNVRLHFTHVLHLAASGKPGCFLDLLEGVGKLDPPPRVLYAASTAVYRTADPMELLSEETNPRIQREQQELSIAEKSNSIRAVSDKHSLSVAGFLFSNVYGPMDQPDSMLGIFADAIISGRTMSVYNDGEVQRAFTYVGDIVDGLTAAVADQDQAGVGSVTYDLDHIRTVSTKTVISLLETHLSRSAKVEYLRCDYDSSNALSKNALAKDSLGYQPSVSFEEGLKRYVDWYRAHEISLMPCAAEGSHSDMCFDCPWSKAAAMSRELTKGCEIVVYTVSTQPKTSHLFPARSENAGCNIAFLSEETILFNSLRSNTTEGGLMTHNNWTVVGVGNLAPYYSDGRKSSRIPKLTPGRFSSPDVSYVLWVDTSILLRFPVKEVARHLLRKGSGKKAVFGAVRHPTSISIINEADHVMDAYHNKRRFVTLYPELLLQQKDAAEKYLSIYKDLRFNNVFEGAIFIQDMKSPLTQRFRRRWFREYQKWADRDQISGGFVIAMMNYEFDKTASGKLAEYSAVGVEDGETVYFHVMNRLDRPLYSRVRLPFNP